MKTAIILKDDLRKILESELETKRIIAPAVLSDEDFAYTRIANVGQISFESNNIPFLSAKEFFFCNNEILFRFEHLSGGDVNIIPLPEPPEQIFFGIRSCDLKGIRFLEQFYRKMFNDETVTGKIDRTLFISMACSDPSETCFCVCCDGGPFLTENTDIQLTDLGDRYFCDIYTRKGEKFFQARDTFLKPAQEKDMKEKSALVNDVDKKFKQRSYMSQGVKKITLDTVPPEIWEKLSNQCIGCGSCTYVCPTCTCFTVYDRMTNGGGTRIRTWDSCNYAGFTREVSGHNPRQQACDRLKRRFFHKLSYHCLQLNGRLGCVGCGRCVLSCPNGIDMSTFVTAIRECKQEKNDA